MQREVSLLTAVTPTKESLELFHVNARGGRGVGEGGGGGVTNNNKK